MISGMMVSCLACPSDVSASWQVLVGGANHCDWEHMSSPLQKASDDVHLQALFLDSAGTRCCLVTFNSHLVELQTTTCYTYFNTHTYVKKL